MTCWPVPGSSYLLLAYFPRPVWHLQCTLWLSLSIEFSKPVTPSFIHSTSQRVHVVVQKSSKRFEPFCTSQSAAPWLFCHRAQTVSQSLTQSAEQFVLLLLLLLLLCKKRKRFVSLFAQRFNCHSFDWLIYLRERRFLYSSLLIASDPDRVHLPSDLFLSEWWPSDYISRYAKTAWRHSGGVSGFRFPQQPWFPSGSHVL